MGARGPQPTPKPILALRGSNRATQDGGGLAVPSARPPCPRSLKGDARRMWNYLVPRLEAAGVVAELDLAPLVRYCRMWQAWLVATSFCERTTEENGGVGPVFVKKRGGVVDAIMELPQAYQARALADALTRLEDRFGVSPAARARLRAAGGDGGEGGGGADPMAFFGAPKPVKAG